MRAVVWQRKNRVRVQEIPDPELLEPQDAVIRVTSTAVCGSDLLLYEGCLPVRRGDVLGHQAMGVVEEVGFEVENVEPGDRVVVAPDAGCARAGCGQAQLLRARSEDLVRVSPEHPDDTYVFLSDVIPTAWQAVQDPGESVAVFGLGPAGQMCVRAARLRGAQRVLAIDSVPERLEMAERHGAEVIDLNLEKNGPTALTDRTSGRGVDTAVDCAGMIGKNALAHAKAVARRVAVVGTYPDNLRAAGIHAWAEELLPMVMRDDDPFGLGDFVTHRVSIAEAPYVYELLRLKKDGAITVVFEP
jgi:threonine dehydrogenase-like Zn-dependent dehydrogenase